MKLYHGTNVEFEVIDLRKSRANKDFGRGFYLSKEYKQALELAEAKVALAGGEPIVLQYEFDEQLFVSKELRVLNFASYTQDWAEFIIANRNNKTSKPVHEYDVVIGPIANDRVGLQLWRFGNHDIDMPTLINRLKYMKGITYQYYFGTEKAIKYLKRL